MAWETVPPPNYAAFDNSAIVGNALGNLVSNYQQAQQGQQRTQANDLRNQQDKMLLDQSKAFAGGVPMNPDGTPNYSAVMKMRKRETLTRSARWRRFIQHQQNIKGRTRRTSSLPAAGERAGRTSTPVAGSWALERKAVSVDNCRCGKRRGQSAVGDKGTGEGRLAIP